MVEKKVLNVKCPGCGIILQVKTRSAAKTVACPKCQATMTVATGPTPAPAPAAEELPFAAFYDEAPMPMAEPLPAGAPMPFAEPILPSAALIQPAPAKRRTPVLPIALAAAAACVVVTVGIVLALKSGGTRTQGDLVLTDKPPADKTPVDQAGGLPKDNPDEPFVPSSDGAKPKIDSMDKPAAKKKAAPADDPGSAAKQAAKAQMEIANKAYLAADSAWQQRRNWRLAHEGRLRAMGIKLVEVNQEPTKIAVDQAWAAFQQANRVYQQTK